MTTTKKPRSKSPRTSSTPPHGKSLPVDETWHVFRSRREPSVGWAVFDSDLGWMACRWRDEMLESNTFGHRTPADALRAIHPPTDGDRCEPSDAMRDLIVKLLEYAQAGCDEFAKIPLNLAATTRFQRRVLECCRAIPPGSTATYAALAKRAGHPGAARAVGNVMRQNRFPLIVPCHRVVGAAGALGGYSAPTGLAMKRRLLALEKCPLVD